MAKKTFKITGHCKVRTPDENIILDNKNCKALKRITRDKVRELPYELWQENWFDR